jgi:hypothetical protein
MASSLVYWQDGPGDEKKGAEDDTNCCNPVGNRSHGVEIVRINPIAKRTRKTAETVGNLHAKPSLDDYRS